MYRLTSKLVIFRNIDKDSILFRLADICRDFDNGSESREVLTGRILDEVHRLLDLATAYGFDRNLWHNYLAYLLAMTENPFTLVCEKKGNVDGTVNEFARNDFAVFYQLFHYDFSAMEEILHLNCFSLIQDYTSVAKKEQFYNKNVSARVQQLSNAIEEIRPAGSEKAGSAGNAQAIGKPTTANGQASGRQTCETQSIDEQAIDQMYDVIMDFYRQYGVGQFGMNKAFRITGGASIVPIIATSSVVLDDLVGYEQQKEELKKNTEAFLAGKPANNCLLYGDAGTGKSTSIKALLNLYYEKGLRIIEVYKHDFKYLPEIISIIKSRNYRFIIYMDDLSFESAETEYKYLKAVIEGDLEVRPDNVLIYATSNRRHLIRETFSDRADIDENDVHRSDTMAERLSLAARFGINIGYFNPKREEYFNIVRTLAARVPDIKIPDEELLRQADRWALRHGEMSGRSAQQFVNYLIS